MDKKNNNILKKYMKKYTTKDRLDMSKGGRVKAAVGGPQKLKNITNYTPMPKAKVKPPVKAKPKPKPLKKALVKKPIEKVTAQPGQPIPFRRGRGVAPTTSEEKVNQGLGNQKIPNLNKIIPNLNLGTLQTGIENKGVSAGKPISQAQKELNEINIAQQRALELAQTGQQPAQPSPTINVERETLRSDRPRNAQDAIEQTAQTFQRGATNPATGKTYTPEERRALDASIDQTDFKRSTQAQQTFQQAPVKPKRPNVIQPTAQTTPYTQETNMEKRNTDNYDIRDGEERDPNKVPPGQRGPGGGTPPYTPPGTPPYTPPGTPPGETPLTDAQKQAQFESERGSRVIQTGRTAEQLAAGEIPEGMIPTADVQKIMERRPDETQEQYETRIAAMEADTVQMGEAPTVDAVKVEPTAAEEVATMEAGLAKTPTTIDAATYDAATVDQTPEVKAALGELSEGAKAKVVEINKLTDPATFASISQKIANDAKAEDIDGVLSSGAFLTEGGVRASDVNVSETPDAEAKTREAITGVPATDGQAAEIIGTVGYEAAKRRTVTGTAAKGAAASMIAEVGELPPEITAAIVEDPATMTAQVDENPVEVNAAIAALPTEALVSSQMESLLGGMEDGEVPMWARPAVDAINANMAQRGLSVSTVGRDSLFNAIIQSALPMAQSNAQALQTRAAQNLGNLQQANLQEATQQQQLRLQNLANRQDAASQTAQMSQQMKTLQSQFNQQAVMTTAQQQQQTRTQNLQNRQQAAVLNTQNQQAMNAQNLGNEQQMELANLEIANQTERENMTAENQERLAEMQVAADFLSKNAGFKQQMELANLSNDQQMRLANLSALNQASSENLSTAQQTELANLNKNMQTNLLQANIAKDMGLAQLNVDQQTAIYNATTNANMDMANFNADQQRVLANSKFMQTVAITNMNAEQQSIMQNATAMASLDLATVDQRTKLAVTNAQSFLQMDMANLSNEQQSNMMKAQQEQQRLLSNQSATNAARQFNSASENQTNQFMASLESQMNQFNTAQLNAATQFNTQSQNAANARDANRTADVNKANASILNQTSQFNAQLDFNRQQWNAANEQAVINSNVTWRRQSNMADTAAQNAVNQQNAQNAFGLTSAAQSFLWQELRDQADYDFRFAENAANRKLQAMIAAASSEGDAAKNWSSNFSSASGTIDRIFGTS